MVQNHLLQLLCLIAMEPPVTFDAGAGARREEQGHGRDPARSTARRSTRSRSAAQYTAGFVNGRPVPGYRQEKGVAPDSRTETYAALKLHVDNWRWAGVPFFLRTGKRLPKRASEIVIRFHRTPHMIFRRGPAGVEPNLLVDPHPARRGHRAHGHGEDAGPGPQARARSTMDFRYGEVFGGQPPEAYERLLLDAIHGDATLYARGDWVEQAWKILAADPRRVGRRAASRRRTRRARGARRKPTRSSSATAAPWHTP